MRLGARTRGGAGEAALAIRHRCRQQRDSARHQGAARARRMPGRVMVRTGIGRRRMAGQSTAQPARRDRVGGHARRQPERATTAIMRPAEKARPDHVGDITPVGYGLASRGAGPPFEARQQAAPGRELARRPEQRARRRNALPSGATKRGSRSIRCSRRASACVSPTGSSRDSRRRAGRHCRPCARPGSARRRPTASEMTLAPPSLSDEITMAWLCASSRRTAAAGTSSRHR